MWTRIKHAFTRTHRDPHEQCQHYIRWYSRSTCRWSKWRKIPRDWITSDPALPLKMSRGQTFQITHRLPTSARIRKEKNHA